jgi:hypothetical protein
MPGMSEERVSGEPLDDRRVRARRNEELFRGVNAAMARDAVDESERDRPVEVLCECSDRACVEHLRLTPSEWRDVHASPDQFVIRDGHEWLTVERIVERRGDYLVVEKHPSQD